MEARALSLRKMNNCKHLYADWCHHPKRLDPQEKCHCYYDGKYCPDFEENKEKGGKGIKPKEK